MMHPHEWCVLAAPQTTVRNHAIQGVQRHSHQVLELSPCNTVIRCTRKMMPLNNKTDECEIRHIIPVADAQGLVAIRLAFGDNRPACPAPGAISSCPARARNDWERYCRVPWPMHCTGSARSVSTQPQSIPEPLAALLVAERDGRRSMRERAWLRTRVK